VSEGGFFYWQMLLILWMIPGIVIGGAGIGFVSYIKSKKNQV
jgi:hypothetical protein